VVHLESLFLVVEDIDDNTDEHVEDKEGTKYHEEDEKQGLRWGFTLFWHFVDDIGVNSIPHNADPTFSGHNVEKGDKGGAHIVEILVLVDPIATVIHTVKLINDFFLKSFRHVFHLTVEEIALVKVCTENGEEEQEQDGDDHHISDVGDSVDQ
jgi:hypothetical protein